jgi:hypothetical protein
MKSFLHDVERYMNNRISRTTPRDPFEDYYNTTSSVIFKDLKQLKSIDIRFTVSKEEAWSILVYPFPSERPFQNSS